MKNTIIEICGWYGAVAIVLAYALSNFAIITHDSLSYQLLNLTGGIGIILVSLYKRNYQPAVVNIIWVVIAVIGLINLVK